MAAVTALISGLSVFVNSYGVHAIHAASVYTTAKNLVATLILAGVFVAGWQARRLRSTTAGARFVSVTPSPGAPGQPGGATRASWRAWGPARWLGLAYVGVVGGGIAFVLFFDGLAQTKATPAAFWHDTLVIWVALLAVPLLRERLSKWTLAAIALLVVGPIWVSGGTGHLVANRGELLVLASTGLWALEVVVVKSLLREVVPAAMALLRMGLGAITLLAYLALTGHLRSLVSLNPSQIGWALLTGLLLAAYVATWMTALARAPAINVTAVLVASVPVTWLLQVAAGTVAPAPAALGLFLVVAGAGAVIWTSLRPRDLHVGQPAN